MQWKPIANKYRKGTMKSTLQARVIKLVFKLVLNIFSNAQAPEGVKERVKLPNSNFINKHAKSEHKMYYIYFVSNIFLYCLKKFSAVPIGQSISCNFFTRQTVMYILHSMSCLIIAYISIFLCCMSINKRLPLFDPS